MKDKNPAAAKLYAEIVAWAGRQGEPFELSELAGRFGLKHSRAIRIARRLVQAGVVEMLTHHYGSVPATYRRAA